LYFLRDSASDGTGGDSTGLGVADQSFYTAVKFEEDFGDLGCFSRSGFTAQDDDLIILNGGLYFFALLDDGKIIGVNGDGP